MSYAVACLIMALAMGAAEIPAPLAPQESGQGNNREIWDFVGRSVNRLRELSKAEEREALAEEIFGSLPLDEIEQIARITELMQRAGEAGTIYILPPNVAGTLSYYWLPADAMAKILADKVRAGEITEEQAHGALKLSRDYTVEQLETFAELNRLIAAAIEQAEERENARCVQWQLEVTYQTPPSNPQEPKHSYMVQGQWTLDASGGEWGARLNDPEMSHWAYSFTLPEGTLRPGDVLEFRSIEEFGLFHDGVGQWEGRVLDNNHMSGTLRYSSGGCCRNGTVSGTWQAQCIRRAAPERR